MKIRWTDKAAEPTLPLGVATKVCCFSGRCCYEPLTPVPGETLEVGGVEPGKKNGTSVIFLPGETLHPDYIPDVPNELFEIMEES